jgi:YkoY family integral membrane protein
MISTHDLALIAFLVFLEGILSIDNALVLAMLARKQPKDLQRKALTYGLVGAIVFRLISLLLITYLTRWLWVKFVGGAYLVFIAVKHFVSYDEKSPDKVKAVPGFWKTVALIELTDIAFALDSILAAVALTDKFWVIFAGGFVGVVIMRFAATLMIKFLERYPRFDSVAYVLVLIIGLKVILEGLRLPALDFHSAHSPAFWVFWGIMLACICWGFVAPRRKP